MYLKNIIMLFLLLIVTRVNAEVTKITLHYQIRPPYFISDKLTNKLQDGDLYNLVTKIMNDTKIPYEFDSIPLARSIVQIQQKNERVCVPSSFKTPERESFAVFSLPFFQDKKTVLIMRSSDKRFSVYEKVADIIASKNLTILVKVGFSYGIFIDNLLKNYKSYSHLDKNEAHVSGLKHSILENNGMLNEILDGNADYMLMGGNEAEYLLSHEVSIRDRLKIKTLSDMPEGEKRYFMCSPIIEKESIKKINEAIKKYANIAN